MKNTLNAIIMFVLTFMFILRVDAIDVPTNIQLVNSLENSLELKWDEVPWALWYFVRYSTNQEWESLLDWELFPETNFVELNTLEKWTSYYITLTSVDENWDESDSSSELIFSTKWESSIVEDFKLTGIEVVAFDKLKLIFNTDLEDSDKAIREIKIVNKNDEFDELEVVEYLINKDMKNELFITLASNTVWNQEYELTVIAIKDKDDRNIQLWIDSVENFIIPESFDNTIVDSWLNSAEWIELIEEPVEIDLIEEPEVELIEVPEINLIEESEIEWINIDEVSNKKLPDTWTEHILILILAFVIWILMFVFKYKKA